MSLDITIDVQYGFVVMVIEPDLTLCDLFWECEDRFGSILCKDLAPKLKIALQILKSDPERFKKFNPKNGWGRYEDLCDVVARTLSACRTFSNGVFSAWG